MIAKQSNALFEVIFQTMSSEKCAGVEETKVRGERVCDAEKGVHSCRSCTKLYSRVGERTRETGRGGVVDGGGGRGVKEKMREEERERFGPFSESRKHDGAISQRLPVCCKLL